MQNMLILLCKRSKRVLVVEGSEVAKDRIERIVRKAGGTVYRQCARNISCDILHLSQVEFSFINPNIDV